MVTLRVIFFSGIQQFLDLLHKIELVCDLEKKPKESEKKCSEIRGGGGGGSGADLLFENQTQGSSGAQLRLQMFLVRQEQCRK